MFNATFDSSSLNGKNDLVIESSGAQTYVSSAVLMMLLFGSPFTGIAGQVSVIFGNSSFHCIFIKDFKLKLF